MNKEQEFNPNTFLDSIIEEMGLQNEDPDKVYGLKMLMLKRMNTVITDAISLNIEPETIDAVMARYGQVEDPIFLLSLLIEYSPGSQIAIVEALDNFREQTLSDFSRLKRK